MSEWKDTQPKIVSNTLKELEAFLNDNSIVKDERILKYVKYEIAKLKEEINGKVSIKSN